MPGPPPVVTVFCPGGRWTQVEWYGGTLFLTKRYTAAPRGSGFTVRWRWFSVGIPFYWDGSFTDVAFITLPAGLYTSLEFMPPADVNIGITAA